MLRAGDAKFHLVFKPNVECLSCILRQAVEACEYATEDIALRYRALKEAIQYTNDVNLDQVNHVKLGSDVHRIVKEITGNSDPYRELKRLSNNMALEWLSKLEKELSDNLPFMAALSVAAAGNMIDYGAMKIHETPRTLFDKALKGKPTGTIPLRQCWRDRFRQTISFSDTVPWTKSDGCSSGRTYNE